MTLDIHRRLAFPAAGVLFAAALTLPAPATAESMPAITLLVFLFATAAVGIAASANAMMRYRAARLPVRVSNLQLFARGNTNV